MKTLANLWARTEWKMFVIRGDIVLLKRILFVTKSCMLYWLTFEFEFEQHLLSLIRNYIQVKIDVPLI